MKKLITFLTFFLCIIAFSSCSIIRLTETESIGKNQAKEGVSENEDLRISYDFWGEHGLMYFTIYNKSKNFI